MATHTKTMWTGGFTIQGGEPVEITRGFSKSDSESRAIRKAIDARDSLFSKGLDVPVEAWVQRMDVEIVEEFWVKEILDIHGY